MSTYQSDICVWSMPLYDQTGPENDCWEKRSKALLSNPEEFRVIYAVEYIPPWENLISFYDSVSYSYMLIF